MKTRDKGTTLCPNYASLKLWCDADFCGNRDPGSAHVERPTEKLRKGFVVMFAGYPLKWLSKNNIKHYRGRIYSAERRAAYCNPNYEPGG